MNSNSIFSYTVMAILQCTLLVIRSEQDNNGIIKKMQYKITRTTLKVADCLKTNACNKVVVDFPGLQAFPLCLIHHFASIPTVCNPHIEFERV